MKKNMILMLTLLVIGEGAIAQKVTVSDVEALPGETVSFNLNLSEGKADTYTALQFDVQFPKSGFSTTGDYTVSSSWTDVMSVVGDVDENGVATIPFASANKIAGSEVENLVSVSFKVDESVAIGEYDVVLKNIMFEYGISDKDFVDDVEFKVYVVAAHSVMLDEESTTAPEASEAPVKVTVKRTIAANEWGTICLPFAMTEAQVKAAFGSDVQLGDFTGCKATTDDDENIVGIAVKFQSVTGIEANHPYIIKVAAPITEFTVDGVDIEVEDEPSVDRDEYRSGSGTKKDPYRYSYNSFVGTYTANFSLANLLDEGSYPLFLSGGKFWYATAQTKPMKAFRAYFDFYDILSEVEEAGAPVFKSFGDEVSTGISESSREAVGSGRYYNLQGVEVVHPRKGLYIVNGKKVILK